MSKSRSAQEWMEILTYSINEQESDLLRLSSLQDSYDNKINPDIWPTQSEIPTAQQFVAVEEALGPALDMCFPESNGLSLIPPTGNVSDEQWRAAEWALWTQVQYRMKVKQNALRSIKDCFKCSVGYGIVEPFTITPTSSAQIDVSGKRTRIMTTGAEVTAIRYRYLSPGKVVPYPTGTDFHGHEATPMSFTYDPHPAWQIEAMYEGGTHNGVDPEELQSTFKEIQTAAKEFLSAGVPDFVAFARRMGGKNRWGTQSRLPDTAPESIPIIKIHEQPNREIWIVPKNDKEGIVMLERVGDGISRMRSGLVKWSAWPDGDRWFPMSQPEASQKLHFAQDLWLNFFFDMMSRTKDAVRVIDKSALAPDQRFLDPYQDIYIQNGNASTAAAYLDTPKIDPSIPAVGDVLDTRSQQIRGTHDFTQKNFTRGGTNAFNDLLNTMQARERLSASILETGGLTQVYEHTLAYMQDLVPEEGFNLQRPVYDHDTEQTALERKTVTADDLNHGYEVLLDSSVRRMLGGMSDAQRFQYWQALQGRDDTRPAEVNRIFPLDDNTQRRVFKEKAEVEALQKENRDVAVASQLSGVANKLGDEDAGASAGLEGGGGA